MRIRLTAPRGEVARFSYLDTLHAALINAWTTCGAPARDVVGREAGNWSFGAVGNATAKGFTLKSVVVGVEDERLNAALMRLSPETVRKSSSNGDEIDLCTWDIAAEDLPIAGEPEERTVLPAIMLSPLVLSVRGAKGRWHDDLAKAGEHLQAAVNFRRSRLTGRTVALAVEPDRLYLRANPKHSTRVRTRAVRNHAPAFTIGMMCPLFIAGSYEDLQSAWNLGIGEKNRYGFGCIGLAGKAP